ncbi:unnamed protein product [Closterium sp. Yama58-4]|nr:unnamed protein product [Closterium sp. Yama58-4]
MSPRLAAAHVVVGLLAFKGPALSPRQAAAHVVVGLLALKLGGFGKWVSSHMLTCESTHESPRNGSPLTCRRHPSPFAWLCLSLTIHTLSLTNHTLSLTIHTLSLTNHTLSLTIHTLSLTIHTLSLTNHTLSLTIHTLSLTIHTLPLTIHMLSLAPLPRTPVFQDASDVQKRGAFASFSLPAKGSKYATGNSRGLIKDLFHRYGCHHCGTRRGDCLLLCAISTAHSCCTDGPDGLCHTSLVDSSFTHN